MFLGNTHRILLMTISLVASSSVLANEPEWYIAPGLNYIITDSDRNADDEFGFVIGVGKKVNAKWNMEASLLIHSLDFSDGTGEYDQKGLMFDAIYFYNRSINSSPYAVAGLGFLRTDAGTGKHTNLAANVGVGYKKNLNDNGMALRGDIRYRLDDDSSVAGQSRFNDWIVGVSLIIPIGQTSSATTATSSSPAKRTAGYAASYSIIDSDKDGVKDSQDHCAKTLPDVKVDKFGCEIISLKGVKFETNSAKLVRSSLDILDEAASVLKQRGNVKVQVAGHTDSIGVASYNQELSTQRANTVKEYLKSQGVNADNLSAKGYGETEPVASNDNSAGRAENRRVELRLLK